MALDVAIFLAAMGITALELVEAAAVGLALYGDSRKHIVFVYVILGIIVVLVPALLLGRAIALLPSVAVRLVGGVLLLYFGLRLIKSARRSVLKMRSGGYGPEEPPEKGIYYTAFSVGAIEAFEAAIVLIGLLPNNYDSTLFGLAAGVVIVVGATYILRNHVRKIKQASMKVLVSGILLTFAAFWFAEAVFQSLSDFFLVPLFAAFTLIVYWIANRPSQVVVKESPEKTT